MCLCLLETHLEAFKQKIFLKFFLKISIKSNSYLS